MNIIDLNIDELIPYENNPRKNEAAVDKVALSISAFGFKVPIVIDANNVIVTGHTRLKAAKKLGMKSVPCIKADDLTEEQIKAFRLADNKVAEFSEWDEEKLTKELDDLGDTDMSLYGFDELEESLSSGEVENDDFDGDVPEEPKAKLGDIYQLGNHRLMCGSSTNPDDVKVLMDGKRSRILFTSPPYSDLREYEGGKNLDVSHISEFIKVYRQYADYQCVNLGLIRKEDEIIPYWDDYIKKAHEAGYKLMSWGVWDKLMCGSIGQQKAFIPIRHEWIFTFGTEYFEINKTWEKKEESIKAGKSMRKVRQPDGSTKPSTHGDLSQPQKKMESVVRILPEFETDLESVVSLYPETGAIRSKHPATYPVGLPAEYIKAFTDEGDIVIEPFCGSGTTLIACEQLGRVCYGMELEPKYVDVIIERWEQLTGGKAVKIN